MNRLKFYFDEKWIFGFKLTTGLGKLNIKLFCLLFSYTTKRDWPLSYISFCNKEIGFYLSRDAKHKPSLQWDLLDMLFGSRGITTQFDGVIRETSVVHEGTPYRVEYEHGWLMEKRPRSILVSRKEPCTKIVSPLFDLLAGPDPIKPEGHLTESQVIDTVQSFKRTTVDLRSLLSKL